jgi:hypothetical protein
MIAPVPLLPSGTTDPETNVGKVRDIFITLFNLDEVLVSLFIEPFELTCYCVPPSDASPARRSLDLTLVLRQIHGAYIPQIGAHKSALMCIDQEHNTARAANELLN